MILRNAEHEMEPGVDLTPVIDMVFMLLVFFLVATTFRQSEHELGIALPRGQAAGPMTLGDAATVINVDEAGRVTTGGREVTMEALSALLKAEVAKDAAHKARVRGDRRAPYEAVARVLDVCKGAGVTRPFLDTVPAGGGR